MIKTIPTSRTAKTSWTPSGMQYGSATAGRRSAARCIAIDKWRPVNGDKLVFRYDDGSGEFDEDQVGIRVGQGLPRKPGGQAAKCLMINKVAATVGWRTLSIGNARCWRSTAPDRRRFEAPKPARSRRGIRSRIYWMWYQKQRRSRVHGVLGAIGFGIEIWVISGESASEGKPSGGDGRIGNGRNIVLVPRHRFNVLSTDVKRIGRVWRGRHPRPHPPKYFGWQISILGQILLRPLDGAGLRRGHDPPDTAADRQ